MSYFNSGDRNQLEHPAFHVSPVSDGYGHFKILTNTITAGGTDVG
jgi:hypothetical protein